MGLVGCAFSALGQQGTSVTGWDIGKRSLPRSDSSPLGERFKNVSRSEELARGFLERGKYIEAISTCEEALAEADTTSLRRVLSEALLRYGRPAEALSQLLIVNQAHQDDRSYARIGFVLLKLGRRRESVERYSTELVSRYYKGAPGHLAAIPKGRSNAELKGAWELAIGLIEDIHASDSDALYYFRLARRSIPNNPLLNMRMGKILLRQKVFGEAHECFVRAARGGTEELKRQAERELAKLKGRPSIGN